jgi:hypothetical protein
MLGSLLALVAMFLVARTFAPSHHEIVWVARGLFAAAGGIVLTLLLKPRRPKPIQVTADHNGVFADGAPLVLRQDIVAAYIRPHIDARVMLSGMAAQRVRIGLPDYPLTVEIIRRKGAQLNLDPGGEQAAAALLTALGIPVTMCAPDYRGNLRPQRSQSLLTVAIVIVFLAAFFGYFFYMSTRHGH